MIFSYPTSLTSHSARPSISEQVIVANLLRIAETHNVNATHSLVTHLYVTLKSCSSLLLVGPAFAGKLALIDSVAQALVYDPIQQYQVMRGHAYWATRSRNIAVWVEAQSSLNSQKLLVLLEAAAKPKNADRLYIACLARISPAEIFNIFSVPGLRLFHRGETIPFPPNFRLIGTLDSTQFHSWDAELLSSTSVLQWPKTRSGSIPQHPVRYSCLRGAEEKFMEACIRDEQTAYRRLIHLLGKKQPVPLLTQMMAILSEHGVYLPREATNKVIPFLVNSWTQAGEGLFASSPNTNLDVALNLALDQYILPWAHVASHANPFLLQRLNRLLLGYKMERRKSPFFNMTPGIKPLPGV